MKRILIASLLIGLVATTHAADTDIEWSKCVQYWYYHNVSHNVPALSGIVTMYNEKGVQRFVWHISNPPTKTTLAALDPVARIWVKQHEENAQAPDTGWENLSRREHFFIRCLWRLTKLHYPSMTLEQFRGEIRAEWDASKTDE